MRPNCPQCDERAPERGALCAACADALGTCDGLLPEHLVSRVTAGDGWLVDCWGQPHPIAATGTVVGRLLTQTLAIFHDTVSRAHAEIDRGGRGWLLRDLGSKNGSFVNGERVDGRRRLEHRDSVRFGKVSVCFLSGVEALPAGSGLSVLTVSATGAGTESHVLRDPDGSQELQLLSLSERGVVLHRATSVDPWSEMNLAPLEFELLRVLVAKRRSAAHEVDRSVPTKELARRLPFRSEYANEENVRQAIKRLRLALQQVGVSDLVRSAPHRGYSVAWPVG